MNVVNMATELKIRSDSDLSVASVEEETKSEKDEEPLASDFPEWSSRHKCLQAYICFIMNFSTVLQFSTTVGNYGYVAVFPYAFFRIFIGVPSVFVEIMLGRYIMGNVIRCWTLCPFAKGVTYCYFGVTITAAVLNYISLTYLLKYFISSFHYPLLWAQCSDPSRINCYEVGKNSSFFIKCLQHANYSFCIKLNWETSAKQFWKFEAGNTTGTTHLAFSFLSLAAAVIFVLIINYKGIRSCEKMLNILVYGPIILASFLAFVTYLTPGAFIGLRRIFHLNWARLEKVEVWTRTLEDTVLSLGLGMLPLGFISTHGNFFDNIFLDVMVVVFSDIFCILLVSIPILSTTIYVRYSEQTKAVSGGNLLFKTKLDTFIGMSEALITYPYPNTLWAIVFYVELVLISLGSQVVTILAICEAIDGIFKDRINLFYISGIIALASFLICAPFLFVDYSFVYPLGTTVMTTLLLGVITLELFYGIPTFQDNYYFMMGFPPSFFLKAFWLIAIILPSIFLVLKMNFKIPNEPLENIVFIYIGVPVLVYLVSGATEIFNAYKRGNIITAFLADPEWGPNNSLLRKSRIIFNAETVTKEFMYRQELYRKSLLRPVDFTEQNISQLA